MFSDNFYESMPNLDHDIQYNDQNIVLDDRELWETISSIRDFIANNGVAILLDNMEDYMYDSFAEQFNKDFQAMRLSVMSNKLQREAVCKDSY